MTAAAPAILAFLEEVAGRGVPLRVRAWDGTEAGRDGQLTIVFRSSAALSRILWAPGELGLCRAYVCGDLDLEGDLDEGLGVLLGLFGAARRPSSLRSRRAGAVPPRLAWKALRLAWAFGALRRPPSAPTSEARVRGRRHSVTRDAAVISHHYDLSNEFYHLLLDESMAYSCGYWTEDTASYSVADAQRDKLDLICRKLELAPGRRLLDVGCGWGSLTVHAAAVYGATVTAVTVSKEQRQFVAERLAGAGVARLVDLLHADYRQILSGPAGAYDAVAAIEMGEHVGEERYPAFCEGLFRVLRPEGRFLLQVMSRAGRYPGGGPFIERYIAPDMTMRPLHRTLAHLEEAGFEVRDVHAMREHYARTIRAWLRVLEDRYPEVEGLIGMERARVWRLYLAGGALSFEQNRMGVDQVLCVRPSPAGTSGMAATRLGWERTQAIA